MARAVPRAIWLLLLAALIALPAAVSADDHEDDDSAAGAVDTDTSGSGTGSAAGGTGGPRAGVEEIMVIGEVLETSTQAESEAITSFDQAELDALGIADVDTLALNTPSLHVGQVGQQAVITLRGVGLENLTSVGEAGVGFQVDGVHLARPSGSNAGFFDLEDVQVHRGPTGTRGGRNTNGGRIELWSAKPTEEFDLFGDVKIGNYDALDYQAVLNLPIWNEFLMSRIGFNMSERRGYQDRGLEGRNSRDLDDANEFTGRAQLRSLLFDQRVDLRTVVSHSYQKGNGPGRKLIGDPPSSVNQTINTLTGPFVEGLGFELDDFLGMPCPEVDSTDDFRDEICVTGDPRETFAELPHMRDNEQNSITLLGRWDLPFFEDTVFSDLSIGFVGSWFQNISDSISDFDGTNIPEQLFDLRRNSKQRSLEVYLERADVGIWDFKGGVHLFRENIETDLCFDAGSLSTFLDLDYTARVETKSVAFYGEVGVRPVESLRIVAGLRHTRDDKKADQFLLRFDALNINDDPDEETFIDRGECGRYFRDLVGIEDGQTIVDRRRTTFAEPQRDRFEGTTPMAGFEWQVSDTSSLLFSWTRGFKAGGFPLAVDPSLLPELNFPYESEFVQEWELTSKNEFFDGLLRLNITGFWSEFDPFQICQFNGPVFNCRSDGSATLRGVELEWQAFPTEGLKLNGHFNLQDTRINEFQINDPTVRECTSFSPPCPSIDNLPQGTRPVPTDVSGNSLPKAPPWAGSFGIEYDIDMGAWGIFTPRFQTQFQGETFFRVFNNSEFSEGSFIKYDAKINWASEDGRFFAEVFGVNLSDEDVLNSLIVGSIFTGGQVLGQYQAPRTYGVRFGIRTLGGILDDYLY